MLRLLNNIVDISSDTLSLDSADRDGLTLSASSWCWHQQQSLNMLLHVVVMYSSIRSPSYSFLYSSYKVVRTKDSKIVKYWSFFLPSCNIFSQCKVYIIRHTTHVFPGINLLVHDLSIWGEVRFHWSDCTDYGWKRSQIVWHLCMICPTQSVRAMAVMSNELPIAVGLTRNDLSHSLCYTLTLHMEYEGPWWTFS